MNSVSDAETLPSGEAKKLLKWGNVVLTFVYLLLLASISLAICAGRFQALSEDSQTFTADLINQTAVQDVNGDYIVYQNFSFQPLPLMECNSHSRILILNYIPAIEDVYYLDLTVSCEPGKVYPYQELWGVLMFSLVIFLGSYFGLKFYTSMKNLTLHLCYIEVISLVVSFLLLICQIANVTQPRQILVGSPLLGKVDIISSYYYLSETFDYCQFLTVNITYGVTACYNQGYTGECYQTYEETFEAMSNGETYFDSYCNIHYFPENENINYFPFLINVPFTIYFFFALFLRCFR